MSTSAERMKAKRAREAELGLTTITMVVPRELAADFALAAELARGDRELTVGPMRHLTSGRLVPLRARR